MEHPWPLGFPVPQNVVEFENYQFWELNAWDMDFKLKHGVVLKDIIQRNAAKITELVEEAKSAPELNRSILKQAQRLKGEIDSANNLLEKLNA